MAEYYEGDANMADVEQTEGEQPRESLLQYEESEPYNPDNPNETRTGGKNQMVDVLNAILPPRVYQADGQFYKQRVSADPSSRDHVINLQMQLDERLQERQARENGICPVREELYSQTYDELIRQVTLESPERGLLLLRVRDEVRMTIAAYQTLYQSSITFGMRKTLQAEQGNQELQAQVAKLEAEKKILEAQVSDHKSLYDSIEKRTSEARAASEKSMQEEKDFLNYQAQHLESFLKHAMQ